MPIDARCHRCGAANVASGRFCTNCGVATDKSVTFLSQRDGLIALVVTLCWVPMTVFLGEYESGAFVLSCALGLVVPVIALLAVAVCWTGFRTRSRLSGQALNPVVMILMALAWLSVSVVLDSDPPEEEIPAAFSDLFTRSVCCWVGA